MAEEVILVEDLAAGHGLIIGVATLNVPASLNALTLDMIDLLAAHLKRWERDPKVVCVVLQGVGGKAFCAGGDVRFLYAAARRSQAEGDPYSNVCAEFFTREYALDYHIHRYAKPVLCLGHGIVMGGGLGLMVGASHRVVTDKTKLAMPEISIGLLPDVGATYFLPRLVSKVGLYLALTGTRINGADGVFAGLADFLLSAEQLPSLISELPGLAWVAADRSANDAVLSQYLRQKAQAAAKVASPLEDHLGFIESVCSGPDLASFAALMREVPPGDDWIDAGKKTFFSGSPSIAALIFAQQDKGRDIDLASAFRYELHVVTRCTAHADFVEGVRAVLIDKDQKPQWHPASLEAVSRASISSYLAPVWSDVEHPLRSLR